MTSTDRILTLDIATEVDVAVARMLTRRAAAACSLSPEHQAWVALAVTECALGVLSHERPARATLRFADYGDGLERFEVVIEAPVPEDALVAALGGSKETSGLDLLQRAVESLSIASSGGPSSTITMGWSVPDGTSPKGAVVQALAMLEVDSLGILGLLHEEDRALDGLLSSLVEKGRSLEELHKEADEVMDELEETNRGLIALHAELESAREAEARLAAIVRSSDDAMISITLDGSVASWNDAAGRLLGYSETEIVGKPISVITPQDYGHLFWRAVERIAAGERDVRYDTWRRRKDGSLVEVTITLSPILDPSGSLAGYSALLSDLTLRRRAEEQLATARARAEVFADRERIAHDLHDLVIQRLFASGLVLQGALKLKDISELRGRMGRIISDLDDTILEIRSTIFALGRGAPLGGSSGVRARLLEVSEGATDSLGFRPRVHFSGPVDTLIPGEVAEHLVAVTTEALSNVARHAHASNVEVELRAGKDIVLEISDDGRGIGPIERRSGLANMASRAEALGGTLELSSERDQGTRLTWRVPTAQAQGPLVESGQNA